jgi:hypothetical protein
MEIKDGPRYTMQTTVTGASAHNIHKRHMAEHARGFETNNSHRKETFSTTHIPSHIII